MCTPRQMTSLLAPITFDLYPLQSEAEYRGGPGSSPPHAVVTKDIQAAWAAPWALWGLHMQLAPDAPSVCIKASLQTLCSARQEEAGVGVG